MPRFTAKRHRGRKTSSGRKTAIKFEPIEAVHLSVERLADDGRGIASHEGKTVFVDGAIDSEDVVVSITSEHSAYYEGRANTLISTSPARVSPLCPVFVQCGGCSVQHMSSEKQLAFKQEAVLSQLYRWAKLSPEVLAPPVTADEYGYRQRVRLAVNYHKNGNVLFGFREANSHQLVDIDQCPVIEPSLQLLFPLLRQWLNDLPYKVVSHIELVKGGVDVGVVIRHTRKLAAQNRQALSVLLAEFESDHHSIRCHAWYQGGKASPLENDYGDIVDPRLVYTLNTTSTDHDNSREEVQKGSVLDIAFHPQDFIQSNAQVNQQMVSQAISWLAVSKEEHVVDLFCGVGNFSLPLAGVAKYVTAVEGVEDMTRRASGNARANNIDNIHFLTMDLFDTSIDLVNIVKKMNHTSAHLSVDALLLDPPRSGAKHVCQDIKKLSPKRIVYVSCDSSTFARDAKVLSDNGYHLKSVGIMDMFPQTAHVEVMALFMLDTTHKKSKKSTSQSTLATSLKRR